ncbi:VanZ family protein [Paenibacillus harenae]|uniref:Glycopeptide antibiotics resistance protein n=1 Tax=Paenibacillus harenae TaxID=306543 RepID=A0ABT9U528_PAEHA|nr:VanZ family protein [Paenibacillus harenae]MDQ0113549.1 glycopeptide antibiotics resistance protein [Paenibacillus harenae]
MYKQAYSKSILFNLLLTVAALIYVFIMLHLLLYRDRYNGGGYSYNIVPLHTIKQYIFFRHHMNWSIWFTNIFGNIVLFIPIGIFAPLFRVKYRNPIRLAAFTIVWIAIIELIQMLAHVGSFDIDDIILNTFGALLGLIFTSIMLFVYRKSK